MKRIFVSILLSLLFVGLVSSVSFAQLRKDIAVVQGIVTGVNMAKGELMVQESGANMAQTITAEASMLNGLQKGEEVIVFVNKDSHAARSLKVMGKKTAAQAAPTAATVPMKPEEKPMKEEPKKDNVKKEAPARY